MNPASRIWDIPPPPGTEDVQLEEELDSSNSPSKQPKPEKEVPKEKEQQKEKSVEKDDKPPERPIDRINPYLKNPEYIEYEKRRLERRHGSRSYSRDRYHKRRYSRSRSRDRNRRSRSRSRRRRRRYSSSRSKSRSPSRHHRPKHSRKRSTSRYSRSRSKSASRSRHSSRRHRNYKDKRSGSHSPSSKKVPSEEKPALDVDISEVDMKIEEEEEDPTKDNVFKNDGTFLEMFKKLQEQQQEKVKEEQPAVVEPKKILPVFGKRRGGKVLKTGLVQKVKQQNEEETSSQDAWTMYMKEVRRYKEACCDDDSKTRPLVK